MITKIRLIKNLGCFYDFNGKDISFNKTNIIYSLNGHGKTTFTSIVRSIRENNPNIIIGRKNLKASSNDNITIDCIFSSDRKYIFRKNEWLLNGDKLTTKNNNIIIFDDEFVNNNIFAERFEIGHKKSLYRIIFGADGVKISNELTELRRKKKEAVSNVETLCKKITPKFYKNLDFLNLNCDDFNEDSLKIHLSGLNSKIENINNLKKISNIDIFSEIKFNLPNLDIKNITSLLYKEVNGESHNKAKQEVNDYKKKYFLNEAGFENFIKLGYENKTDNCPFCHKNLDEDIINVYRDYFDKSYDEFHQQVKIKINFFKKINFYEYFSSVTHTINSNILSMKEWQKLTNDLLELPEITIDLNALQNIKEGIKQLLEQKLINLNNEISSDLLCDLEKSLATVASSVFDYNKIINANNLKLIDFSKGIKQEDLASIQKQKEKIDDELDRISQDTKNICNQINLKKSDILFLDNEITKTETKLHKYSESINQEYLEIINRKLSDELQVHNFKLKVLENKSPANANDAFIEITIEISDKDISLNPYKDEEASFKNTLSRGDKNSLAFAFFLAFIEKNKDLDNTIIFFDDPLSSHDDNRQNRTAHIIRDLKRKVSQVFVLTHRESFLTILYKKFKNDNTNYFKIDKNTNGSHIKSLDIKNFDKTEYEKILDKFDKYINYGSTLSPDVSIGNLKNDVRKVFEKILFTKYYNILKDVEFSITSYNHLKDYFFDTNIITGEIKTELIELANISNSGSHFVRYEDMNEDEIKCALIQTLKLIQKL